MKKSLLVIALVCVMVFSFAATAMADHSPVFYFDYQLGSGVMNNTSFQAVFPTSWNTSVTAEINNTGSPHSGYSQSTAKCEVCHAVHRAPTMGTSTFATADKGIAGNAAVSSSRYSAAAWTADATTQMLLRSTVANACIYCHIVNGAPNKMYGGDATLALNGDTAFGWGQFYAHTSGCTSCHAVHGANTFKSADGVVDAFILKDQGVKNLGTIALKIQPEVYGGGGSLYDSLANAQNGTLSAAAIAAGVTPLQGAVTAQCTVCHASYAVNEETINANYLNAELFQPGSWASANGSVAKIFVGNTNVANGGPVSVLPGIAGITYTTQIGGVISGSAGSLIMAYKNHPMKAGGSAFHGAGASANFTSSNIVVSNTGSSACQSCHTAPVNVVDGGYVIQSFPHYTPGYYKFMGAQNQAAFDTPSTAAQYMGGRQAFYSNGGKPAIMNDGYCTKCHTGVGTDY